MADEEAKRFEFQWRKKVKTSGPANTTFSSFAVENSVEIENAKVEEIHAIENNQIKSSFVSDIKQLVIPIAQLHSVEEEDKQVINASAEIISESVDEKEAMRLQNRPKRPLLLANIPANLLESKNDDERFQIDISLRPDEISVKSDVYNKVPVEQFGAALLRGMGWKGEDASNKNPENDKVIPRELHRGLGSQLKPLAKAQDQSNDKLWKTKAEQKVRSQTINIDSLIWLRSEGDNSGKRAKVIAVKGVPGLNKIRVELERNGREIDVDKYHAILLTEEELREKPFIYAEKRTESLSLQATSSSIAEKARVEEKDKKHSHNSSKERPKEEFSTQTKDKHHDSEKVHKKKEISWLRTGIRVKIISKKAAGSSGYLQKATVVDVLSKGYATLRLDNGQIVESVAERHLETVLPSTGSLCMVLLGENVGETALLVEKYTNDDKVLIQLSESLEMVIVDMDSVAACGGS